MGNETATAAAKREEGACNPTFKNIKLHIRLQGIKLNISRKVRIL